MFKKIMLLIPAGLLVFSLFACQAGQSEIFFQPEDEGNTTEIFFQPEDEGNTTEIFFQPEDEGNATDILIP